MKLTKLKNNEVVIVDGMNLFHRVYYKFQYLTNKTGYPTGALFGFFTSLINITSVADSNRLIICWEGKTKNWKVEEDKDYKATRNNRFTEEEMYAFDVCLKDVMYLCNKIGILQTQVNRFEADDIIFYLTKKIKSDIKIVTRDKDMLQLVNDKRNVKVLRPGSKDKGGYDIVDEKMVSEIFHGVTAKQVPFFLAIAGDTGDNVSGVKGLGPVKACSILSEHKYVTKKNINSIFTKEQKKQFLDSLKLVKASIIIKQLDGLSISNFKGAKQFDEKKVKKLLDEFGIKKFNISTLRQLHNKTFKQKIINKFTGANDVIN